MSTSIIRCLQNSNGIFMVMKMGSVFVMILTYRDDAGRSWEHVINPTQANKWEAGGSDRPLAQLLRQTQRTKSDAHPKNTQGRGTKTGEQLTYAGRGQIMKHRWVGRHRWNTSEWSDRWGGKRTNSWNHKIQHIKTRNVLDIDDSNKEIEPFKVSSQLPGVVFICLLF